MSDRSCARCGSANVDPEGYCWSCEYQGTDGDRAADVDQGLAEDQAGPSWPADPACAPGTCNVPGYPMAAGRPMGGTVGGFGAPGFAGPGYGGPGSVQGNQQRSVGLWLGSTMIGLVTVMAVTLVTSLGVRAVNEADAAVQAMPLAMPSTEHQATRTPAAFTGCVIGTWDVTSTEKTAQFDDFGMVTFSGSGGKMIFKEDGLGQFSAEQGTTMSATLYGRTLAIKTVGGGTFRYEVIGGEQINYVQLTAAGTRTFIRDGQVLGDRPLEDTGAGTDRFTCAGNELWLHGQGADSRLARVVT